MTFPESDRAALAAAEEIRIETRPSSGAAHRTIIWVAEHDGTVYVRSVNGPGARWYREATAPDAAPVAIEVDGRRIPVRLEPATDPASIEACSAGLRAKYQGDPSLQSMLLEHTLETTLRVQPG